jgi:hypothetical protein
VKYTNKFDIYFEPSGRGKARCSPNPNYPTGIIVDLSEDQHNCEINLPYPAKECGIWIVKCNTCQTVIAVTAAGRPDDPIKVKIKCK